MKRLVVTSIVVLAGLVTAMADDAPSSRNFAGSIQLDYLGATHRAQTLDQGLAGTTIELSLKLAYDLGDKVSGNVKVCFACHGFELGMAFFDLRVRDELNVRVGRFTPAFGAFPLRHDPANHQTSDKPLAYDMGRMVRFRDWNEGVLPAPWVDNGVEINGTHFFGAGQLDYAVYALSGPKGDDTSGDFDFKQSRSPERYYADNNSEPVIGGRITFTANLARRVILTTGASGMAGHYDPAARLGFAIAGADSSLQVGGLFLRAEYLARWTQLALGDDPSTRFKYGPGAGGSFATHTFKDGFDVEAEVPVGRVTLLARWDGLRRQGNVLANSALRSRSAVLRYTAGTSIRLVGSLRLKTSIERYDFSDFADEVAVHIGIAGPF
jgi:hypothetical protein